MVNPGLILDPPGTTASERSTVPEVRELPFIPDHDLIRCVGSGSSGEVWLARSTLGSYRAVKIVYEKSFRHVRPFEREFRGVQKFEPVSRSHEGLVDILHAGRREMHGYFYYVMEVADDLSAGPMNAGADVSPEDYCPRTLAHELARHKRLPVFECVRLGIIIASALSHLHRRGLIHRDIKPSNIVFVNDMPKLADIGLVAEISDARSYVGTEGFIPPEGPGTAQADIYSLGKVLYEMSTGQDRHDFPELPTFLGEGGPDWDLIQLNKIVLKACRADVNRRYQSADEMLADLRALQLGKKPDALVTPKRLINLTGILGGITAAAVVAGLVWRIVWFLNHS